VPAHSTLALPPRRAARLLCVARRFADPARHEPGGLAAVPPVAQARTLLAETDLPVEAIAARVGLTSAVTRRFRTQVDTTPGAYRRAFRVRPRGRSVPSAMTGSRCSPPSAPQPVAHDFKYP
jgi:hypothetical protein